MSTAGETGGGGAIWNNGNNMSVINCNFSYNKAFFYGSAIWNIGNNLIVNGSTFNSNVVTGDIGYGGAILNRGSNMVVSGSNFTNNTAQSGGAINNRGSYMQIIDSDFINNSSNWSGGAICNEGPYTKIINSNFIDNKAIGVDVYFSGGAIYNGPFSEYLLVNGSNFTNNVAPNGGAISNNGGDNILVVDSNFNFNKATNGIYGGGAILNMRIGAVVNSCNFIGNTALYTSGGAIYNRIDQLGSYTMVVQYNRFINNTSNTITNEARTGTTNNVNANFNWWGSNNITPSNLVYGDVILTNWIVMELSANLYKTIVNNTTNQTGLVNISYQLSLFNSTTNTTSLGNSSNLPYFPVNITWTNSTGTYNLINVDARGTYSNSSYVFVGQPASIQAIGDNSNIILNINPVTYDYGLYVNSSNTNPGDGSNWVQAVLNISAALQIILDNNLNNCVIHVAGAGVGGAIDYIGVGINTNLNLNASFNNLTIIGEYGTPQIIGDSNYVFNITGNNITLINLAFIGTSGTRAIYNTGNFTNITNSTFRNFNFTSNGGAIYNTGNGMSVSGSDFTNNTANADGGAIYNSANNLSVLGSNFINNIAIGSGGAIYNNGGVNMSVNGSDFTNNSARTTSSSYGGGAIFNTGSNMSVNSSSFANNNATNDGGAIYNYGVNLSVTGSNFSNNTATGSGGAIINRANIVFFTNSNFTYNNAKNNGGGAISNLGSNMTVISSNFINNTASGSTYGRGAAISNSGDYMLLDSLNFINNTANITGGAIYNIGLFMNVTANNFTNNSVNGSYGGAIYNRGANISVVSSNFTDNTANGINSAGGAIYNWAANMSVIDSNFTNNTATYSGGAINNYYGDNMLVVNSSFNNNYARILGGAIYNLYGNNVSVNSSNFTNNSATSYGGAITQDGAVNMSVVGSNFTNNNASSGGAIATLYGGANMSIKDSSFVNNTARDGGAIYNQNGVNITVTNSNFSENKVTVNGGAIYNTGANMNVTDSNFTNNIASNGGGAIYSTTSANMSVMGSKFTNNNAPGGGAIYNTGANMNVTDSNFTNNYASYIGGGIYNDGNMSVSNNTMIGNNAPNGKVIYNAGNMGILNLTYLNNLTVDVTRGQTVTLNATLTDDMGNNITGQIISFYLNGTYIGNATVNEGFASFNYIMPLNATGGIYPVSGNYTGRNGFNLTINQGILRLAEQVNLNINKNIVNPPMYIVPGTLLTFTITVTNSGPDIATNVTVYDYPFFGSYYNSTGTGYFNSTTNLWYIPNIPVDGTATLNITFMVGPVPGGIYTNNVIISHVDQTNTGNDIANASFNVNKNAQLSLLKTVNASNANVGDYITYSITVSNLYGPDNVTGLVIQDKLDSRLIFVNSTSPNYDNATGLWNIGSLNIGQSVTLNITVIVNGTGMITNAVNITSDQSNINNETNNKNISSSIMISDSVATKLKVSAELTNNGKTILMTGVLTDVNGNPIANQVVDFYVNNQYVGSGITNANGVATYSYTSNTPFKNGNYTIRGIFVGDNQYLPSEDIFNLEINSKSNDTNKTNDTNNVVKDNVYKTSEISATSTAIDNVSMKKTGIPIIAIVLLLLSIFGISVNRKGKK